MDAQLKRALTLSTVRRRLAMRTRPGVLLCLFVVLSVPLWGQKFTGTIRGLVTDKSGAIVANASVSIANSSTGDVRTVTTNQSGEFVALELNPGKYTVTVRQTGFKEFVSR